jgi:hypothetical protein
MKDDDANIHTLATDEHEHTHDTVRGLWPLVPGLDKQHGLPLFGRLSSHASAYTNNTYIRTCTVVQARACAQLREHTHRHMHAHKTQKRANAHLQQAIIFPPSATHQYPIHSPLASPHWYQHCVCLPLTSVGGCSSSVGTRAGS